MMSSPSLKTPLPEAAACVQLSGAPAMSFTHYCQRDTSSLPVPRPADAITNNELSIFEDRLEAGGGPARSRRHRLDDAVHVDLALAPKGREPGLVEHIAPRSVKLLRAWGNDGVRGWPGISLSILAPKGREPGLVEHVTCAHAHMTCASMKRHVKLLRAGYAGGPLHKPGKRSARA